jgi:hypothetical protein
VTYLTGLHHTLEVLENVEFLSFLALSDQAANGLENIKEGYESVRECLARCQLRRFFLTYVRPSAYLCVVLHPTDSRNSQAFPYNANALRLNSSRLFLLSATPQCLLEVKAFFGGGI